MGTCFNVWRKIFRECLLNIKLVVFIFFVSIMQAGATPTDIHGTVTDSTGRPLQGATVNVKGTKKVVLTDSKGNFNIDAAQGEILRISIIGYQSREIVIDNNTQITIVLNAAIQNLGDVVVIGYGAVKRSDLTGSIATVSAKDYKDQPLFNVSNALQGRATGIAVTNTSGAPGAGVKIRIRGANSINTSNDPLYVIDGIALASNDLNSININDIESINVLKDASATAIYGSRGANGVVIVTTKKGNPGGAKLSYDVFISTNKPNKKYRLMDPRTFAKISNLISPGIFSNPDSLSTKGTDLQDWVYAENLLGQSHQLTISGSAEKSTYFISGFYQDQPGLIINNSQKAYGLRVNLTGKLGKKINYGLNLFVKRNNLHNPGALLTYGTFLWPPTEPVYADQTNGVYNRKGTKIISLDPNPYMLLKENDNDVFQNIALVTGNISYAITDWLSFTANIGLDANTTRSASFNNDWVSQNNPGSRQGYGENYAIQNSNILAFHKVYNAHDISASAIFENSTSKGSGFNATGAGLTSLINGYNNLALNATQSISSYYSNWAQLSYIGRIVYSYERKYLLTATLRRDGSSKFQGGNKWGNFPSVGLGWNILEENFAKDQKIFSHLKLRGGWGRTGNDRIAPYSTLGLLSQEAYAYGSPASYVSYYVGNPATPNIKWETTDQTDGGVELGFLNDRINITADYYNKNTSNLLLLTPIANYNGGGVLLKNVGKVNNKGFEIGINATPIDKGDFQWTTSLNLSYNKNNIVNLGTDSLVLLGSTGGILSTQIQAMAVNQPMGSFYLMNWAGIYQNDDPALGYKAGDNRFVNAAGGNLKGGTDDRMIIGNATPKYQFGFGNTISYKRFSLNVYIQGAYGNKIFNQTYGVLSSSTSASSYFTLADAANYWSPSNQNAEWPVPGSPTNNNRLYSSHYLQNGSYARLKNLSLSYKLPSIKHISSAVVSISAQNIATVTKYKGLDPEVVSGAGGVTQHGVDFGSYPSPKTYTARLNITF